MTIEMVYLYCSSLKHFLVLVAIANDLQNSCNPNLFEQHLTSPSGVGTDNNLLGMTIFTAKSMIFDKPLALAFEDHNLIKRNGLLSAFLNYLLTLRIQSESMR